jgi:hypothetical protein
MGQRSTLLANTWRKINHHRTEVSKEMKDYIGRPRPGKKRLTGTFNIWHLLCHVGVLQEILYVYFFLSRMKKYLLLLKIKMCFFTITIRVTVTATGYRYYSILYITLTFFPLSFFRGWYWWGLLDDLLRAGLLNAVSLSNCNILSLGVKPLPGSCVIRQPPKIGMVLWLKQIQQQRLPNCE